MEKVKDPTKPVFEWITVDANCHQGMPFVSRQANREAVLSVLTCHRCGPVFVVVTPINTNGPMTMTETCRHLHGCRRAVTATALEPFPRRKNTKSRPDTSDKSRIQKVRGFGRGRHWLSVTTAINGSDAVINSINCGSRSQSHRLSLSLRFVPRLLARGHRVRQAIRSS